MRALLNPSDGDDDTIPTTMITDTRNYTINWFWPRIAVLVPIITINSSFQQFGTTTMTPNATINCSPFLSFLRFYNKLNTYQFVLAERDNPVPRHDAKRNLFSAE